jgi:CheY-like chemotaxis protein
MQASKLNVFVIDDDDIYQYLTQKELEKSERVKTISTFSDGIKALNYLKEIAQDLSNLPHIIFLDVNMPILSGWAFIEELRQLRLSNLSAIKIYIISSSFDRRDIEKAREYEEIADYLVKPVSRTQIASILEKNEQLL